MKVGSYCDMFYYYSDEFVQMWNVVHKSYMVVELLYRGDRLSMLKSDDVYRRQILASKVDRRTLRVKNI